MSIDAYTDTWRAVAAKANEIIEASRSRLEVNDQSYGESQYLRGRVSALREILDMAKPAVVVNNQPVVQPGMRPRDRSGI
jgi:hypothetical protein